MNRNELKSQLRNLQTKFKGEAVSIPFELCFFIYWKIKGLVPFFPTRSAPPFNHTMTLIGSLIRLAEIVLLLQTRHVFSEATDKSLSLTPRVANFKLNIHRLLEGSRIRNKRQTQEPYGPPNSRMRVGSSSEENLPYLSDYSLTFWIPVQHQYRTQVLVGTQEGHLMLFELSDTDDRAGRVVSLVMGEGIASKAMAFSHEDEQWFVVLQTSPGNATWIRFYQRVGRGLERRQTINLEGYTDFDLVTVKGIHYLAVVTTRSAPNQPILALYHWTRTQFDVIASRTVMGPRSIACWVLDGTMYLSVAQDTTERSDYHVGSSIFLFNAKDDSGLVLLEMLSTFGPSKVLHFYVGGSHYVVFVGQQDAAIYLWSNDQFLLWQIIEGTAFASDASILTLTNGEVVIVIALKEEALFLTLDASGHYIVTYRMLLGFNLGSLQFMYSGRAYYALALFAPAYNQRPQSVWKLILGPYSLPTGDSLDSLNQCLKEVSEMVNERQTELNNVHVDLGRVWLKDANQTVTAQVVVTGDTSSSKVSVVAQVLVITDHKILPDSSLQNVEDGIARLRAGMDNVQEGIGGSMLKSIKQDIRGSKHFNHSIYIPSLNTDSTSFDVPINGVLLSRINQYALRKVGNQRFLNPLPVNNIHTGRVSTWNLNGIPVNDLLLLGGDQEVTGKLKFPNVIATDMMAESVNWISTENMVTKNSHQIIRDLKQISILRSSDVEVHEQTNGENLNEFSKSIITTEYEDDLKSRYAFESTTHIKGDLFLKGLVNGEISFSQMEHGAVTKNTEQILKGPFVWTGPEYVVQNLDVAGRINGMDLRQLMTTSTDQLVHGDMVLHQLLRFDRDVLVHNVNGVDLDQVAVLKTSDPQFVSGFKTFRNAFFADFIEMTEYVTLDGVDPSLLVQDMVKHKEGVVKHNSTAFHNVVVLGDLTAIEGVNGHAVIDLPHTVWLKSIPQDVDVDVSIKKVSLQDNLEVNIVNTINLETDVVSSYKDEVILSIKTFNHDSVVLQRVDASEGARLNGLEIVTFTKELEDYVEVGTVRGQKTLQTLEIYGDIDAQVFNEQAVRDLMRPNAAQKITGRVQFVKELTVIRDDLKAFDVKLKTLYSLNFVDFVDSAVTSKPKYAIKNKAFLDIRAQDLFLYDGSKLSGIQLNDVIGRVVTLDRPEQIISQKTFLGPLHLRKSSSSQTLNGQEWRDIVNNVVYNDEFSPIPSLKEFTGLVTVSDVYLRGLANGVNISLTNRETFLKSINNQIKPRMTFIGNLHIGKLVATSLNSIMWEDLVFTYRDEPMGDVWFFGESMLLANMFVVGRINGCDLVQLGQRALYTHKNDQTIEEEVTIENIQVIGNLNLKRIVNDISVEDLERNFISIQGDQIVTSDISLDSGFRIENLDMRHLANNVSVPHIIRDAVRHSIPQSINGYKHFHELNAGVSFSSDVFISGSLDGVDVNALYSNTVWKHSNQVVESEKIFNSIGADFVTLDGYVNGLRLPIDVVRTHTSEHVFSPVVFQSDVTLGNDVVVQGTLDGEILASLIRDRQTLTGDQIVYSQLSFLRDVVLYGESSINGTVNNIFLENVCKVNQMLPLDGYKAFYRDVNVLGSLFSASVNGFDIAKLSQSTLRNNQDEFVNELQIFDSSLKAGNSLITETINGISISQTVNSYGSIKGNVNSTLGYFEDSNYRFYEDIRKQMHATENSISRFAYFILIQEISAGPTTKILNGYRFEHSASEFSHSMVIWTSQKHCTYMERCCQTEFSYWMRVKKSGHLMIDSEAQSGRFYPIHNPGPVTFDRDFTIWTNVTDVQPKWCGTGMDAKMHMKSLTESSRSEIFMNIKNAPLLSEVKSFRQGHLYAVAGFFYDRKEDEYSSAVVYVFNEVIREWKEHQLLPSFGVLSLDLTYIEGELLLAVGSGMDTHSSVYKWNYMEHEFVLVENILPRYVTSTLWLKQGSVQLLAMASVDHWPKKGEDCFEFLSGGQIDIYIYEGRMRRIQSIHARGVVSMVSFNLGGDAFLVAASHQLQTVLIYEWKGYAGFSLIQSMFVGEVRHLNTYTIGSDVYMTVAVTSGPSKLLKLVAQGRHALTATVEKDSSMEELGDEAIREDTLVSGC